MKSLDMPSSDYDADSKKKPADIDKSVRRYQSESGTGQESRYSSGSMQALSEIEYDEYEFVTFILTAADIAVPKNLLDLFKLVGRSSQDRAEVLNQIAKRARKRQ